MKILSLLILLLVSSCISTRAIIVCRSQEELQKCTEATLNKKVFISNIEKLDKDIYQITYEEK